MLSILREVRYFFKSKRLTCFQDLTSMVRAISCKRHSVSKNFSTAREKNRESIRLFSKNFLVFSSIMSKRWDEYSKNSQNTGDSYHFPK